MKFTCKFVYIAVRRSELGLECPFSKTELKQFVSDMRSEAARTAIITVVMVGYSEHILVDYEECRSEYHPTLAGVEECAMQLFEAHLKS